MWPLQDGAFVDNANDIGCWRVSLVIVLKFFFLFFVVKFSVINQPKWRDYSVSVINIFIVMYLEKRIFKSNVKKQNLAHANGAIQETVGWIWAILIVFLLEKFSSAVGLTCHCLVFTLNLYIFSITSLFTIDCREFYSFI